MITNSKKAKRIFYLNASENIGCGLIVRTMRKLDMSLWQLQSETQEELDALFAKHPRVRRVGYRPLRKGRRV